MDQRLVTFSARSCIACRAYFICRRCTRKFWQLRCFLDALREIDIYAAVQKAYAVTACFLEVSVKTKDARF
jgi:hypothetical protein